MYLEWHLLPMVRLLLREHPDSPGVLVCVAQYWNDDADDEVHVDGLVFEPDMDPRAWPPRAPSRFHAAARAEELAWLEDLPPDDQAALAYEPDPDTIARRALDEWWREQDFHFTEAENQVHPGSSLGYMEKAAGLAAFCVDHATQADRRADAWRPMWWITPDRGIPGRLEVALLGTIHQPAWEDRYPFGLRPGVHVVDLVHASPSGVSMEILADLAEHQPDPDNVRLALDEMIALAQARLADQPAPATRIDCYIEGNHGLLW